MQYVFKCQKSEDGWQRNYIWIQEYFIGSINP